MYIKEWGTHKFLKKDVRDARWGGCLIKHRERSTSCSSLRNRILSADLVRWASDMEDELGFIALETTSSDLVVKHE